MKYFIALGTNVADRLQDLQRNLEQAVLQLNLVKGLKLQGCSPAVSSPAMVPKGAPSSWQRPFLNAVVSVEFSGKPRVLLQHLKNIEVQMGRVPSERWAPRVIDLDILYADGVSLKEDGLQIPHPGFNQRSFVLEPLKHFTELPILEGKTILEKARSLSEHHPLWMEILNLPEDSFSDGGCYQDLQKFSQKIEESLQAGVHILDIGAESTRPGAHPVSTEEEWSRLAPALEIIQHKTRGLFFKPWISVDTYHTKTAEKALAAGCDLINDVSGLSEPEMLQLIAESKCQYVLMHSLSVPADPKKCLPENSDVISELRTWAEQKFTLLTKAGVDLNRVIFDPGIGFGKNAFQSVDILKRVDELMDLPVRILVGHSRKSFMKLWTDVPAARRDSLSVGISLALAKKGVDILRVHESVMHKQAFESFQQVSS